jgi:hypothetical protein
MNKNKIMEEIKKLIGEVIPEISTGDVNKKVK